VNPLDPDPAQLDAGDIARALANQCRFGGHSRVFYSVAQHCVIVSRVVEERGGDVEAVFAALMHDAAEAYLGETWHWPELDDIEPLDLELTAWPPDKAADEFAKRYAELEARRSASQVEHYVVDRV
jgi:5'-deoxynucleotidase YfbR-like HD superfamily hydrolase